MFIEEPQHILMHINERHYAEMRAHRNPIEETYYTDGTYYAGETYITDGPYYSIDIRERPYGSSAPRDTLRYEPTPDYGINFVLNWRLYSGIYLDTSKLERMVYEEFSKNYNLIFDMDGLPGFGHAQILEISKSIYKFFMIFTDKNRKVTEIRVNDKFYDIMQYLLGNYIYISISVAMGLIEIYLRALSRCLIAGTARVEICPITNENGPAPISMLLCRGASIKKTYIIDAQCDITNEDRLKPYVDSGLYGKIYDKYFPQETFNRF